MILDFGRFLTERQKEAVSTVTRDGLGGCVFARVGEGKTRIAIVAMLQFAEKQGLPEHRGLSFLVVCRRAAFYDWAQELVKLHLWWDVKEIEDVRPHQAFQKPTLVLASHGKLINETTIATLQSLHFDAVTLDEAYLFANPQSKRTKALKHLPLPRVVLSGSLMPSKDLIQIYSQVAAAGRGQALARHATEFRQKFQIGIQENHYSYYPKKGAYAAIMNAIAPFTFVYLPRKGERPTKETILKVRMTEHQTALIKELKSTYAVEGMFELNSMTAVIQKAQQISNGWFSRDDGEVETFESGKVNRCVALVEEILNTTDTKVVIWCAFRNDIVVLQDWLTAAGLGGIATLQGGETFNLKHWLHPNTRICLATEASGSSVNHFSQVPHAIYFSQDCKWLSLQQSKGRTDRQDSKHDTAYYTFLHSEGSMDARIYYTVRHSQQAEAGLISKLEVIQWLKDA